MLIFLIFLLVNEIFSFTALKKINKKVLFFFYVNYELKVMIILNRQTNSLLDKKKCGKIVGQNSCPLCWLLHIPVQCRIFKIYSEFLVARRLHLANCQRPSATVWGPRIGGDDFARGGQGTLCEAARC